MKIKKLTEISALSETQLNQLETIDLISVENMRAGFDIFCTTLKKCKNLKSINISSRILDLDEKQLQLFLNTLLTCKDLNSLAFYEAPLPFSAEEWKTFFNLISQDTSIKNLCFNFSYIHMLTPEDWEVFGDTLTDFTLLENLDLSWNPRLLQSNDNNLISSVLKKFGDSLARCKSLKNLNLTGNTLHLLNAEGWKEFGNALSQCKSLTNLNFSENELSKLNTEEWKEFGNVLAQCESLTSLNLGRNQLSTLDPNGWRSFGSALGQCKSLTSLNLSVNGLHRLNIDGWKEFSNALAKSNTLKMIDFEDLSGMPEEQFKSLIDAVNEHPNAPELKIVAKLTKRQKQIISENKENSIKINHINIILFENNISVSVRRPILEKMFPQNINLVKKLIFAPENLAEKNRMISYFNAQLHNDNQTSNQNNNNESKNQKKM